MYIQLYVSNLKSYLMLDSFLESKSKVQIRIISFSRLNNTSIECAKLVYCSLILCISLRRTFHKLFPEIRLMTAVKSRKACLNLRNCIYCNLMYISWQQLRFNALLELPMKPSRVQSDTLDGCLEEMLS